MFIFQEQCIDSPNHWSIVEIWQGNFKQTKTVFEAEHSVFVSTNLSFQSRTELHEVCLRELWVRRLKARGVEDFSLPWLQCVGFIIKTTPSTTSKELTYRMNSLVSFQLQAQTYCTLRQIVLQPRAWPSLHLSEIAAQASDKEWCPDGSDAFQQCFVQSWHIAVVSVRRRWSSGRPTNYNSLPEAMLRTNLSDLSYSWGCLVSYGSRGARNTYSPVAKPVCSYPHGTWNVIYNIHTYEYRRLYVAQPVWSLLIYLRTEQKNKSATGYRFMFSNQSNE